jgi:hypothetical protein
MYIEPDPLDLGTSFTNEGTSSGFHDRCSRDSCSPATFAPEAQIKPQSKLKLTLCLALTHTHIVILIYVLTLTQTRAYILNYSESKCRWGASVVREQVSGEQQLCYPSSGVPFRF